MVRKIIAYGDYYREFMSKLSEKERNSTMQKKTKIYDVSAELDSIFGKPGSESRTQAENQAWEEYNAQILLDARKSAGMSQQELADKIGADKSYISRVERGLTTPSISMFYRIVAAMGLTVNLRPASL